MNDKELYNKMSEIFSLILDIPIEKINYDISPKNTKKWDSLNHLKIIMEIESTFNVDILPEEAINLFSFKDSIEIIKNKIT